MVRSRYPDLGYLIHTNRELGLMLRGVKPLASFAIAVGDEPAVLTRYLRLFDRHASTGRFVFRERTDDYEARSVRRVLYAQSGEEWRIDAMLRLYDERDGWSVESERLEGRLLGYQDSEIDRWLFHIRDLKIV